MVMDILIYIIGFFITVIVKILPEWVIWPDIVLNAIDYTVQHLAVFNFIFPIDQLFVAVIFLINFFIYFGIAKLIFMFVNWVRGTGKLEV